ncbi:RHS repeat-associated core domain-containing protein [Pseudomonas sp. RL_105y_Pfl2_101]|uniref:RHS repeat-associated core domain-containing protein n=1 Tax=Pseudomonas sp. RL_105y_Pfl2_101 TaxID=3088708 RepID=UPI0030D7ECDA
MPTAPRETVLCRYRYDPLDRLVDCAPSAEAGIQRFYCKSRLATEIQGAVQRSVFQHDDQLLAQLRREDVKVETALLATDQQRSVLNVLDANRVHPLAYSPYGHRPAANGLLSLLGFNGERPDPVTGHYLLGNGYRAFNPVLMRFNSPDSLSPFGEGGINYYVYCGADPINRTDPTGHILTKFTQFFKGFWQTSPASKTQLTDLNFDTFQEISKHLSSTDMNNLRLASKQTKHMADQASGHNFNSYLNEQISHFPDGPPKTQLDKLIAVGLGRQSGISSSEASKLMTLNKAQQLFPKHSSVGYSYMTPDFITGRWVQFERRPGHGLGNTIVRRHSFSLGDKLGKLGPLPLDIRNIRRESL